MKSYLVGRRHEKLQTPDAVQVFLQFTGGIERPAFDEYLNYVAENHKRLWTILVRGPIGHSSRGTEYVLPSGSDPADREVWNDAVHLMWSSIDKAAYTALRWEVYPFAPTALTLALGAARHIRTSMDIYALLQTATQTRDRYKLVYQHIPQ
jgi:hypothetical protein